MKANNIRTLVNFRLDYATLKAFDDACALSGSTRTAILGTLIREFTAKAADTIPEQMTEQRRVYTTLRAAVRRAEQRKRVVEPKPAQSALRHRPTKSFTEFLIDDPIVRKRGSAGSHFQTNVEKLT